MKEYREIRDQLKRTAIAITFGWIAIILTVTGINVWSEYKHHVLVKSKDAARSSFSRHTALRLWIASHGGVYVPISEITPPNPYLSHIPDRDIATPSGKKLTLLNPAYAMRHFAENAENVVETWHLTSLNLLNPDNVPDEWEKTALQAFEQGAEEALEFADFEGKPHLRLMKPLKYQERCRKCHDQMGYKIGDIRGGVGTYYPLEESLNEFYDTTKKLVITYLVILFFGLAGIRFAYLKQKKSAEKQKRLEAILQQSQKMEALGTMAGGIAHDFNNILAIILGNADIAQDDIPVGNPAKESIGQVLIAATRAKDLVKQILSFSRQDQSEKEPLYLCRLIEENMKSLRSVIPTSVKLKTNITAKCRDNSADCLMVHIDSTQIYQVFLNLCINAVQAMDEKGVLEISLDEITFEDKIPVNRLGLQPGTYEYLSVSDTGPGISPKIVQNIFDPFFTTKEVGKGTGMGLSVVHGIIEEHGGKIFVESEPGKGATFHIYFPAIEIEREEETEEVEPLLTGKERILLVDDDEMLAAMGKGMLERILGYSVTAKTDSSEALDLFQKNPSEFDLVITDQTMPNITGIELSVKLLAIRPNLPIILCTGYSSTVDRAKARQVGISEFVSKPFNKYEIAKLLRQVLDEEQQTTSFVLGECEP